MKAVGDKSSNVALKSYASVVSFFCTRFRYLSFGFCFIMIPFLLPCLETLLVGAAPVVVSWSKVEGVDVSSSREGRRG